MNHAFFVAEAQQSLTSIRARTFSLLIVLFIVFTVTTSLAQTNPPISASSPQEPADVIRINTTLITVPVSVSDKKSRYLANLRPEQFHVYENDVEQQIAYFASVDKPFLVALLLDISDSTEPQLKLIQEAAITFIDLLRPGDQVIVVAFDSKVRLLAQPQMDRQLLRAAIRALQSGSGTSLYAVVEETIKKFPNSSPGRKAMVVLTDGLDTTSPKPLFTFESSLQRAAESDVAVYPVQINASAGLTESDPDLQLKLHFPGGAKTPALAATLERAREYLHQLARTGGQLYSASDLRKLESPFAHVAADLRRQYSLGYYPKSLGQPGELREIKVIVDPPNVVVHARKSYVSGGPTPNSATAKP
ncbi:MAG TPA: VWA domain-containing protein [Pyrinomonadaceae bacterium]|jgi:VWFA-related protein|nr:VWA domain-containing protein [Pyrinomonadaceae bacterium]